MKINDKVSYEGYSLTEEQLAVLENVSQGKSLMVNALAGTGKTFILKAISAITLPDKKGLYLCFNKSISEEAKKDFPSNVSPMTIHSLAYKALVKKYNLRERTKVQLNASELYEKIFKDFNDIYGVTSRQIALKVFLVIKKFCQSADEEISQNHLSASALSGVKMEHREKLSEGIVYFAQKAWELLSTPSSELNLNFDIYLKIWALSQPTLKYDFILIDEAQDQTPVTINVLNNQKHLQRIWVGDKYQQIYSFRGAVNSMEIADIDSSNELTKSFRFGNEIALLCNNIISHYLGEEVSIKGYEEFSSKLSSDLEPNIVLCRTNLCVISELMYYSNYENKRVSINIPVNELVRDLKEAEKLYLGMKTNHEELKIFNTWKELVSFSRTEEGAHLRKLVSLFEQYDIRNLTNMLNLAGTVPESLSDLLISTVHKVKGREWDVVRLADDFKEKNSPGYKDEDARLLYVAATRAKHILDISGCAAANL